MDTKHSSISIILFALVANFLIAIVKFIVAFLTRSSAMLAEAVHSSADTLNQVFLIIGIKRAKKKPDPLHPFGYSGELYFWSFIVAILLFTAGAAFSIYVGINKVIHPEKIQNIAYALSVLCFSILAESVAFTKASKKINQDRGDKSILEYLKFCKHSELIVVFLEDLAALCGLSVALIFIITQHVTGILILDGIASILIGLILVLVAFFLARETQSLLIGEGADPVLIKKIAKILTDDYVSKLIHIKSMQLGPDNILIGVKLEFVSNLKTIQISEKINEYEAEIRSKHPIIKGIFIEPDIYLKDRDSEKQGL